MRKLMWTLVSLLLLCGCNAENQYSHEYRCYFIFYASMHTGSQLLAALNAASTGVYAYVSTSVNSGVRHLYIQLNNGKGTEDLPLTTAKENQISCELGANNGVILGHTAFNGLKAYDRQCPNCLDSLGNWTNSPLTWTNNGQWVTCSRCNRSYDLSTGVITAGAKGRKMLEYQARYDGATLVVQN